MLKTLGITLTCCLSIASNGSRLAAQAAVPAVVPPQSELASLVDRYTLDRTTLTRRYNVDYSTERYERLTRFYKEWQAELAKFAFAPLGVEGRIDHRLLSTRLDYELRLLSRERAWVSDTT